MAPSPTPTAPRRWRGFASREGLALLAVLLLALGVRVASLVEFSRAPDFDQPAIDAGFHDYWARSIATPEWERWTHVADPRIESTPFLRPPGYPYFLAGIHALFGGGYLAPRVVQILLGLSSVVLLWWIGRRLFGPGAGLAAALWLALSSTVVYFEGELHAETLLITLMLALFALVLGLGERLTPARAAAAGLALGVTALVRSNVLVLAPLLLVWLWWVHRRELSGRRLALAAGALLLGAALGIAPATVRNLVVAGEFVPISSNLGINLFMGNNPAATPLVTAELAGLGKFETCYDYPALVQSLERQLGRPLSYAEVSRYFTGEAVEWMLANPADFLELTARKAALFWGPVEIAHNKVVELELEQRGALRFLPGRFSALLAAALLGFVALRLRSGASGGAAAAGRTDSEAPVAEASDERRRRQGVVLLLGWIAAWFLSVLPFFVAARYRLPLVPFLALPAGVALVALVRAVGARSGKRAGILLLSFAGLWFVTSREVLPCAQDPVKWHMDRGRAWNRGGRTDLAIGEFEAALAVDPSAAQAHFSLGHSMMLRGNRGAALQHFLDAARFQPDHSGALNNIGSLLAGEGRFAEARPWFERLVRAEPTNLIARLNLARLLAGCPVEEGRDGAEAVRHAEEANRQAGGRDWPVLEVLAAAYAESGRFAAAVSTAEEALELARGAGQLARTAGLREALQGYRASRPWRLGG